MPISQSARNQIASLVQRKRDLQAEIRRIRERKTMEASSISNSIRQSRDKNYRESLRNRKTSLNESCQRQIESVRNQISNIAYQISSLRRS